MNHEHNKVYPFFETTTANSLHLVKVFVLQSTS